MWYSCMPIGNHTLASTVQRICKNVGIGGYKTNHSLHVSAVTRLSQAGLSEDLIMSRSGHRSSDGVRAYKRVSETQRIALSDVLNLSPPTREAPVAKKKEAEDIPPVPSSVPVDVAPSHVTAVTPSASVSPSPSVSPSVPPPSHFLLFCHYSFLLYK